MHQTLLFLQEIPTKDSWKELQPKLDCPELKEACTEPHCRQIYARINETALGDPTPDKWGADRFGSGYGRRMLTEFL